MNLLSFFPEIQCWTNSRRDIFLKPAHNLQIVPFSLERTWLMGNLFLSVLDLKNKLFMNADWLDIKIDGVLQ